MGEYHDKAFGNMSPVQIAPDGSKIHIQFKNCYLFAGGTIRRVEEFIDENITLSQEDKFKLLDFLSEALKKDYTDLENRIKIDVPMQFRLKRINEEFDNENKKDRHTGLWFLLIALLICSAIACLYSYFH